MKGVKLPPKKLLGEVFVMTTSLENTDWNKEKIG